MNPPSLIELQKALQQYLLNDDKSIDAFTLETEKFSKQQRLTIYQEAYRLRLIDALKNDYPALHLLLGNIAFEQLLHEYITAHPSQHPSLRWLGEKLAFFLRDHPNWQQYIHVIELAEFEWAQTMSFDAQDVTLASIDDLRVLDSSRWPSLQLTFQPAVWRLAFFSNAPDIWYSLINHHTGIDAVVSDTAQLWLVWRNELQIMYRSLEASEAWSIESFAGNANFTDVCAGLCEWFPEDQIPITTVQYLQQWLHNGLIAEIH